MGMLLTHHDGYYPDADEKPAKRKRRQPEPAPAPEPASAYEALTDNELLEAYTTNVAGEADSREAMTAELSALDAE